MNLKNNEFLMLVVAFLLGYFAHRILKGCRLLEGIENGQETVDKCIDEKNTTPAEKMLKYMCKQGCDLNTPVAGVYGDNSPRETSKCVGFSSMRECLTQIALDCGARRSTYLTSKIDEFISGCNIKNGVENTDIMDGESDMSKDNKKKEIVKFCNTLSQDECTNPTSKYTICENSFYPTTTRSNGTKKFCPRDTVGDVGATILKTPPHHPADICEWTIQARYEDGLRPEGDTKSGNRKPPS